MLHNWLQRWMSSRPQTPRRGRPASRRPVRRRAPALEELETLTLLSFAAPVVFDLPATPKAVAVGHFTDNGRLDVVTANDQGTVSVLLGNADGTLQNPVAYTLGATPDAVAV